jgi:hypothetical protein
MRRKLEGQETQLPPQGDAGSFRGDDRQAISLRVRSLVAAKAFKVVKQTERVCKVASRICSRRMSQQWIMCFLRIEVAAQTVQPHYGSEILVQAREVREIILDLGRHQRLAIASPQLRRSAPLVAEIRHIDGSRC